MFVWQTIIFKAFNNRTTTKEEVIVPKFKKKSEIVTAIQFNGSSTYTADKPLFCIVRAWFMGQNFGGNYARS